MNAETAKKMLLVSELLRGLKNNLHGSGFDGEWFVWHGGTGNKIKFYATIDYHCMDEYGSYDGWLQLRYTIVINPESKQFELERLVLPGLNWYGRSHYGDKDYYEDCMVYALEDIKL